MTARIRLATETDAAAVAAIYAPYVRDTAITFETEPPTAAEMRGRIAGVSRSYPWLVCESAGEVVGYVYASRHRDRAAYRWAVDTAVYIRPEAHRAGVGRALYASLFELLRHQGFYRAYAGITLPNEASVGLHAALGFDLVGVYEQVGYKLGAWHAVSWYTLALQPPSESPREPLTPVELAGDRRWGDGVVAGEKLLRL